MVGGGPGPNEKILEEISTRVTKGMDEADAMRLELYLMDIMRVVGEGGDKKPKELLATVKNGDSYANLNTVMDVPDSTTLEFIAEVREKCLLKNKSPLSIEK
ncbi:MAG: hypothetical protein UX72_C0034G0009 [Parcubacteria group bacterium GW2011_GWA2_47_10]|nr:MAG: hypothetical protein UX72_C0034G0009 [Parcubacteria group bacterium GW2011_GWA2_47_10]